MRSRFYSFLRNAQATEKRYPEYNRWQARYFWKLAQSIAAAAIRLEDSLMFAVTNVLTAVLRTTIFVSVELTAADAGPFKMSLGPYVSQDYDEAFAAYVRHDYGEALTTFSWLAHHDYPSAQTMLGEMYLRGLGIPPDSVAAMRWFSQRPKMDKHELSMNSAACTLWVGCR